METSRYTERLAEETFQIKPLLLEGPICSGTELLSQTGWPGAGGGGVGRVTTRVSGALSWPFTAARKAKARTAARLQREVANRSFEVTDTICSALRRFVDFTGA